MSDVATRRNNAEYLRKLRAAAVAAGLCKECRCRPQKEGRVSCETCLERRRLRGDAYRAAGLCECGKQPIANHTQCQRCLDRGNAQSRRYAKQHAELGLCSMCSQPVEPGRKMCAKHLRSNAARSARLHRARADAGLCVCGDTPPDGRKVCDRCVARNVKKARARRENHRAIGLCVTCTKPARPGAASCELHLEKRAAYERAYRAKRAQQT